MESAEEEQSMREMSLASRKNIERRPER
jgi:hypothetical protein